MIAILILFAFALIVCIITTIINLPLSRFEEMQRYLEECQKEIEGDNNKE